MENVVVMPFDYETKEFDMTGYKAQNKLRRVFTKFYDNLADDAVNRFKKRNAKGVEHYKSNIEEYYGEVLEEIEKTPTSIISKVLEAERPISEMYKRLNVPKFNYVTGKKIFNKNLTI